MPNISRTTVQGIRQSQSLKYYDKFRNATKRKKSSLTLLISYLLSDLTGSCGELYNKAQRRKEIEDESSYLGIEVEATEKEGPRIR